MQIVGAFAMDVCSVGNRGASMMWLVAILSAGPSSAQLSSYTPLSFEEYQEAIATKFPVKAALAIDERVRLSATCFPPFEGEFQAVMSFKLSGKADLEVLSLATSLRSELDGALSKGVGRAQLAQLARQSSVKRSHTILDGPLAKSLWEDFWEGLRKEFDSMSAPSPPFPSNSVEIRLDSTSCVVEFVTADQRISLETPVPPVGKWAVSKVGLVTWIARVRGIAVGNEKPPQKEPRH